MHRRVDEVEFVIFDTETTGLNPEYGDRVVEIAGMRIKGEQILGSFQTLLNPGRPVSEAAFAVNQITSEMLAGAPSVETAMPEFLVFIKDACLCSYNAGFDLGFLQNELKFIGRQLPQETAVVDVLKMARRIIPGMSRYALWFVAGQLGIKAQQQHRAFSDVEMTLEVFRRLKAKMKEKGVEDFLSFLHLFGVNPHMLEDLSNQKIIKIQEAIDLGLRLNIKYLSSSNAAVTQRDVLPKEVRREKSGSYVVGFCYLRNEERSFRIDSILELRVQ
ncbi:MAG TPA: exonuclease domain-containing protein [Patescibacteria group bacterium]|nr:exonuclease domain-containing protein [Patescibacteria group bacterium]